MSKNTDAAPSTPAAQWRVDGEQDPHGAQYDCERAALTLGYLSDDELANGAFMNYDRRQSLEELLNPRPGQHMPIVWMTAVKDRIRWLSRALEHALLSESKPAVAVMPEEVREALTHAAGGWRGAACGTRDDEEGERRSADYNRRAQVIEDWLAASPAAPAQSEAVEMSPEFTDTSRAALAWVLLSYEMQHPHIGQAMRFALGMGADDPLTDVEITRQAQRWCEVRDSAGAHPAQTERAPLEAEIARLNEIIHSPESDEFLKGVSVEAEYQRQLHGVDSTDARFDWHQWFWVTGYLLGKALAACKSGEGNGDKARHHLVTTAALINNWHNTLTGKPAASVHSNSGKCIADLIAEPASGGNG